MPRRRVAPGTRAFRTQMVYCAEWPPPGRGLAALGRGGVPVAMAAPSAPVRRREADGLGAAATPPRTDRRRPSPVRTRIRTREDVASTIYVVRTPTTSRTASDDACS